ncbi:MAG: YhbY family RNA-binding protein [Burkholderiales bacterium]|nr:YhbY family RNA-binding protein [Burkholderiales bacterium]
MKIELSAADRRALKARAHHLNPMVIIGDAGLTPAIEREVDSALKAHELIKVRVAGDDRDLRQEAATRLADTASAALVGTIGKLLILYRPKPPEAPRVILGPPPRRTSGSKKQIGNKLANRSPGAPPQRKSAAPPRESTAPPRKSAAKRSESRGSRTPVVRRGR